MRLTTSGEGPFTSPCHHSRMSAIGTATQGMISAAQRFDASAVRTVQGKDDPVGEVVAQVDAKATFSASAAILRTADEMTGSLLDILA